MNIQLASIKDGSLVDGAGLRYVLFCQGCPHRCEGCFNPSTHSFVGGKIYDCDEIVEKIRENKLLSGITFSGGECFMQSDACVYIAEKLRDADLDFWAYTGFEFEQIKNNKLIPYLDVLVDGMFDQELKNDDLEYAGSSNQRVIDVQMTLLQNNDNIILWRNKCTKT